jgi:hypothetical protein
MVHPVGSGLDYPPIEDPDSSVTEERKPEGTPPNSRFGDYRAARMGAGIALTMTLVFLLLYDAISPSYDINPFVMVTIVTTVLTLFGLEIADQIKKG